MYTCVYFSLLVLYMGLIKKLLANVVICWFLLWLFSYFSFGISISLHHSANSDIVYFLTIFAILWFVFWLLNFPIKNILKILSFPVNTLTLWIFSLVINVVIFYLFTWICNTYSDGIVVVTLGNILQTLILSFAMTLGIGVLRKFV